MGASVPALAILALTMLQDVDPCQDSRGLLGREGLDFHRARVSVRYERKYSSQEVSAPDASPGFALLGLVSGAVANSEILRKIVTEAQIGRLRRSEHVELSFGKPLRFRGAGGNRLCAASLIVALPAGSKADLLFEEAGGGGYFALRMAPNPEWDASLATEARRMILGAPGRTSQGSREFPEEPATQ